MTNSTPPNGQRYWLRFTSGPRAGERIYLDPGWSFVVGRSPDADVVLPDIRVSSRHCRIINGPDAGGWRSLRISDMTSKNGTTVNGFDVGPGQLRPLHVDNEIELARSTTIIVEGMTEVGQSLPDRPQVARRRAPLPDPDSIVVELLNGVRLRRKAYAHPLIGGRRVDEADLRDRPLENSVVLLDAVAERRRRLAEVEEATETRRAADAGEVVGSIELRDEPEREARIAGRRRRRRAPIDDWRPEASEPERETRESGAQESPRLAS